MTEQPDPTSSSAAPPDRLEVANRLRPVVVRLNRLLRQQADAELTPTKLVHLAAIDRYGPVSLGDLAAREGVAPPTVTKVVDQLEAQGLVAREPDERDRRVVLVRVTEDGHRYMTVARSRSTAWLAGRLAAAGDDDVRCLDAAVTVLERLLGHAAGARAAGRDSS